MLCYFRVFLYFYLFEYAIKIVGRAHGKSLSPLSLHFPLHWMPRLLYWEHWLGQAFTDDSYRKLCMARAFPWELPSTSFAQASEHWGLFGKRVFSLIHFTATWNEHRNSCISKEQHKKLHVLFLRDFKKSIWNTLSDFFLHNNNFKCPFSVKEELTILKELLHAD